MSEQTCPIDWLCYSVNAVIGIQLDIRRASEGMHADCKHLLIQAYPRIYMFLTVRLLYALTYEPGSGNADFSTES